MRPWLGRRRKPVHRLHILLHGDDIAVAKADSYFPCHQVEKILQGYDPEYKGPGIGHTISEGPSKTIRDVIRELTIANVWAFYFPLMVVVSIIATPPYWPRAQP
jgi:hypothetical protein